MVFARFGFRAAKATLAGVCNTDYRIGFGVVVQYMSATTSVNLVERFRVSSVRGWEPVRPMSIEPARIAVELRKALEFYHGTIEDLARESIRLLGVNETDRRALEIVLGEGKSTTPGMLAERLGLTAAGATVMLNRLEKQGYIARSLDPTDRRRVIVVATDLAARRMQELISPLVDEGYQMMLSWFDPAELEMIAGFLTRAGELQRTHRQQLRNMDPYPRH
ncbi:MarR family winged helix-turn-helix transcriptional regulator [Nocardia sp. NPDC004123]